MILLSTGNNNCSSLILWKRFDAVPCFGNLECVFVYLEEKKRAVWPIPVFLEALCLTSGEVWPV